MSRLLSVITIALAGLLCARAALAGSGDEVARLVAADSPPSGVVFEIVTGNEAALEALLPAVREHARTLRARFPGLPVAVLTHGSEQFSLLSSDAGRYPDLHRLAATLDGEERIPVQVCGNHASFRGKGRADYPDWVDVVESAPSKLAEYRAAGWVVIR